MEKKLRSRYVESRLGLRFYCGHFFAIDAFHSIAHSHSLVSTPTIFFCLRQQDNGNYIVDLHFDKPIKDPKTMATELKNVCGVVEHGLFCDMASAVIIAGSDGISVKEA